MKSHRTDVLSLFFGVAFLLISGGYLVSVHLDIDVPDAGWFIAGAMVFLGLVAAVTALVPRRKPVEEPARPTEEEPADRPMLAE